MIKDLPVGQNLVDHILTGIDLVTLNISLPLSVQSVLNPMSALNYSFSRQGNSINWNVGKFIAFFQIVIILFFQDHGLLPESKLLEHFIVKAKIVKLNLRIYS